MSKNRHRLIPGLLVLIATFAIVFVGILFYLEAEDSNRIGWTLSTHSLTMHTRDMGEEASGILAAALQTARDKAIKENKTIGYKGLSSTDIAVVVYTQNVVQKNNCTTADLFVHIKIPNKPQFDKQTKEKWCRQLSKAGTI